MGKIGVSVLIMFDKWVQELYPVLVNFFNKLGEETYDTSARKLGWKLVEDELKLLIILEFYDRNMIKPYLNKLIEKLGEQLSDLGIKIIKWFYSEIESIEYEPRRDMDLIISLRKMFRMREIFKLYLRYLESGREPLCLRENKDYREPIYNFFCENLKEIEEIASNLGVNVVKNIVEKPLLETLQLISAEEYNYSEFLDKSILFLECPHNRVLEILYLIEEMGLISFNEIELKLTPDGEKFLEKIHQIVKHLEKYIKDAAVHKVEEFFEGINNAIGYMVLRDGTITKFSFGKILYSLANIGIDIDTAIYVIDEIVNNLQGRKVVTADELIHSIQKSLLNRDPTGVTASRYIYYIKTKDFVKVLDRETFYPYNRQFLRELIYRELREDFNKFSVPESLVKEFADNIFESLRRLIAFPPQEILLGRKATQVLPRDFLNNVIEVAKRNFLDDYELLIAEEPDALKVSYVNKTLEEINKILAHLENRNDYLINLYEAIKYSTLAIMMQFRLLPTKHLVKNIALTLAHLKRKSREVKDSETLRNYRRLIEYLKLGNKLCIKLIRGQFKQLSNVEVVNYCKFTRKIMENLSEHY